VFTSGGRKGDQEWCGLYLWLCFMSERSSTFPGFSFKFALQQKIQDEVSCSVVVKALCYKPEGLGYETRWDE
jgi:hypothetical protein